MRQELLDLLLEELDPQAAAALRARVRREPALARELSELEAIFGLMRRGEEIEAPPALRAALLARAERVTRPGVWQRLRQLPGLVRYRFKTSLRFRVAMVSLCAHLVLVAVLYDLFIVKGAPQLPSEVDIGMLPDDAAPQPAHGFTMRLRQRRLPHGTRLKRFGVSGQEGAIRRGLEVILARQAPDGSFGDAVETAWSTLALLAEGDSSVQSTRRGRAIRRAISHLLARVRHGDASGAILTALVEDYGLAYDDLQDEERIDYARAIRRLIREARDDDASREGLALARLAGFTVPKTHALGDAAYLLQGNAMHLLGREATRLRASIVLARGQITPDQDRFRQWGGSLFQQAVAQVEAGKASGVVVLTLQAPYRL